MNSKPSFGLWLKQRRKALDLTREELAGRIGCAAVTLYKIEVDERHPSKQIAELLALHLSILHADWSSFVTFARSGVFDVPTAAPWNTPFHSPSNLPITPTSLIGRAEDIRSVRKRLSRDDTRLLTLIGAPGIGKTRLAIQIAADTLDDFADGVFFVALAPITDASLVGSTIVEALALSFVGLQPAFEKLKRYLHDKQLLLVLDNFEQILTATPQIAELLSECPWLKILVMSRAPLRIRAERQFPVAPSRSPRLCL